MTFLPISFPYTTFACKAGNPLRLPPSAKGIHGTHLALMILLLIQDLQQTRIQLMVVKGNQDIGDL